MNDKKFCPNCGAQVDANAEFCPNCGYKFSLENDNNQQHIYDQADGGSTSNSEPTSSNDNFKRKQPNDSKNKLITFLIIIIVLLLAGGGYAAYKFVLTPGHTQTKKAASSSSSANSKATSSVATSSATNSSSASSDTEDSASSSTSVQTISADDANSLFTSLFKTVSENVKEDSFDQSDFDSMFVSGSDNSYYKDLANWVDAESNNVDINSVDATVQNLTTKGNVANFQVKYVFYQTKNRPNHVQVFNWHAQLKKDDQGNLKIISCASNNKAVKDYESD
ncbi:zinc ribbon domain-containing protein [Nicoliella lavandulae]|uniref:Zinc ribbon domain-containing protein n=1 Tax=Nicoliella lavandulae TaxID=3082954 RepID=A0ABU8SJ47_9LACO